MTTDPVKFGPFTAQPGIAGPHVSLMEVILNDLVSAVGISERAGVELNTVSVWQRRYSDFPKPLEAPGVDRKLWRWSEVEAWREGRKRA